MTGENYETNAGALDTGEGQTVERDPRGANAQRHGILSEHVPPSERGEYAQHVEQMRVSTGAQTYLEQRLADRAALALWRLDRVARYEAAQVAQAQRGARAEIAKGEAYGSGRYAVAEFERLALMTRTQGAELRADPQHAAEVAELEALSRERQALALDRLAAGGSAEGLSAAEAQEIGEALGGALLDGEARPADMVRAMMNRPARKGEASSVEEGTWTYEPDEVPGLLTFAREFWGADLGPVLTELAGFERAGAGRIRAALAVTLSAEADALALAALPATQTLEKVTRYEAHLERVLYRALHDLEASRRERQGEHTPPPLRGVLDELGGGE